MDNSGAIPWPLFDKRGGQFPEVLGGNRMYNSVLLLALAPIFGSTLSNPAWQSDYRAALQLGEKENKPLAVFINSGKEGWNGLTQEKELGANVRKLLAENYICLYIDSADPKGKLLADIFEAGSTPTL